MFNKIGERRYKMTKNIKKIGNILGSWAFLIGIILAIAIGVYVGVQGVDADPTIISNAMATAAVIGIVIGLFNIGDKEVTPFLLSGTVLILASVFGNGVTSYMPSGLGLIWS